MRQASSLHAAECHHGARYSAVPQVQFNLIGFGLLTAATFLCCMPYLVFGPIAAPSQVQPWAALLCWLFIVQRVLTQELRINNLHIMLGAFAVWFLLYVYQPGQVGLDYYLRKSASFLISWSIVIAMQYLRPDLLWRMLKITLPLWTLFGVLGYVSAPLYHLITSPLVPTVIGVAGGRGTSSLAPEATDFGFTMVFMLLIGLVTRHCLQRQGAQVKAWPIWLAIANIAMSKSGSGFFAAIAVGGLYYLTRPGQSANRAARYFLIGLVTTALIVTVGAMPETGVRGIDLLVLSLQTPQELINTTLSYRIVHNVVGVLGMLDSRLMGYGAGAFVNVGPHIYVDYDLGRFLGLTGWYGANAPLSLASSPVAFFPVILLEYGFAGLVYIFVLFRGVGLSRIPYKPLCLTMMFLTWLQSFPAAYPPFWLIVGLAMNPAFQEAGKGIEPFRALPAFRRRTRLVEQPA